MESRWCVLHGVSDVLGGYVGWIDLPHGDRMLLGVVGGGGLREGIKRLLLPRL